jgi:hypothetical protein
MNGYRAKVLRRTAESLLLSKEFFGYSKETSYILGESPKYKYILDEDIVEHLIKIRKGIPTVLSDCKRKLYQNLKTIPTDCPLPHAIDGTT